MNKIARKIKNTFGSLPFSIANIILVAISISIVHFLGYFYNNFPLSFAQIIDSDFYLWFCFQFAITVAISSIIVRFLRIIMPLSFLFTRAFFAMAFMFFFKEKHWLKEFIIYTKRERYFQQEEYQVNKATSYILGIFIFSFIYLGDEMWRFLFKLLILSFIFLMYFINTSFRSYDRFKRRIRKLNNPKVYLVNNTFTASFIFTIVFALAIISGSLRFDKLLYAHSITNTYSDGFSDVSIVGFIKGSPIKVKNKEPCLEFSVRFDDDVFQDTNCKKIKYDQQITIME